MSSERPFWQRLGPVSAHPTWLDLLRPGIGAAIGLGLAGLLVAAADPLFPHALFLFAPLGASAVLVFAVPNSPLAQPWNCVVGNAVSALYTLALLHSFPNLHEATLAALAVGGAIALMLACRALHPPGGAMALLTVLASVQLLPLGWHLLTPVVVLSGVLVGTGVLYHWACGRTYLHHAHPAAQAENAPRTRSALALSNVDLAQLLERFDQTYNLSPEDLGELLAAAEEHAIQRRFAAVTCGAVMSAQLLTIRRDTPLEEVADIFHEHLVKCLPVVGARGELLGRVQRADLFDWLWEGHRTHQRESLWRRIHPRRTPSKRLAKSLMREPEMHVQESTPVGDLLEELSSHSVQFISVLRGDILVGVITRSDVIRTLLALK
jgi:CBS domain-containing membrane protein